MTPDEESDTVPSRRRYLSALSAAGLTGLAGCGFGGDGDETTIPPITTLPPERTPTDTPTQTATPTPTEEPPTTTQPTTTTQGVVEGRTWRMFVPPPNRANVQYNPVADNPFWFDGEEMMRATLFQRSLVDLSFAPQAAKEWTYESGVLDIELHDDLYWVSETQDARSPVNVTADDWVFGAWYLTQRYLPGLPLEGVEKTGEYSFRVFFKDTWRAKHAIGQDILGNFRYAYNATFWQSFLDRMRDATTDDARNAIRQEAISRPVTSPRPVTNMPFRVSEIGEDRWQLSLRTDEDPQPRWVDDLTFDTVEIVVEEALDAQTTAFTAGELPFAGSRPEPRDLIRHFSENLVDEAIVDIAAPFETATLTLPRAVVPGCYAMNLQRPPTDNVHFRRAVAYVLDRSAHLTRFMEGDRVLTGFSAAIDESQFISDGLMDTLQQGPHDNYGYAAVKPAEATAEMEAGGFERDSAGNWLYQTGENAGEPIRLTIPAYPQHQWVVDLSTDFVTALAEFGIDVSIEIPRSADVYTDLADGNFELALTYWGGRLPTAVFRPAFGVWEHGGQDSLWGEVGFPEVWEGPPVGEFATPPSAATDATVTYDIPLMAEGLRRVGDGPYQENTDRLAWVFNQSMARLPIGHLPWIWTVNTDTWNWPLPTEENAEAWISIPRRELWQRGFVKAVPEDSG